MSHNVLRKRLAGSVAFAALAASVATAQAADVTISNAAISGGKLVISGTASPNSWVRLDGQAGSGYNVKSGADGAFSLSVVYHPGDCVVELQKVVSPTTVGEATEALVANCGPAGLTPRGAWSGKAAYASNDLVTYEGSSYRAKRNNAGKQPGAAAVWEVFAAKGDSADGADGEDSAAAGPAPLAPPTGPAGGDLTGNYPNPLIRNRAVTSTKLGLQAVTFERIGLGAVRGVNIAPLAVKTGRLADAAVTSLKIADGTVNTVDIADGAITSPKINDGQVNSLKVLDNSLTADDLATDSVGASEIAADVVGSSEIAAGVVGSDELDTVHEHFGPSTNIADTTAHDGLYAVSTSTVNCGVGEDLLSVSIDWTNIAGHFETFFGGVDSITRGEPDSATVRVGFDGGPGPATYVAVATCIF